MHICTHAGHLVINVSLSGQHVHIYALCINIYFYIFQYNFTRLLAATSEIWLSLKRVCAADYSVTVSHALGLSLSWLTVPSLSCDLRLSLSCRHCPSKNFIASAARVALKTNQRYKGHKYFYELKAVVLFGRKAA